MNMLDECVDQILLSPAEALVAVADLERRTALVALSLRRLERSGEFAAGGALSMKEWLRDHARMSTERAGDLLATGRFLDTYEAFAEAALSQQLSGGQIDAARTLNRAKFADLLAENQHELAANLASLDIASTVKAVRHWRECAEAVINEQAPPVESSRELTMGRSTDDVLYGRFTLDDAAATELEKAVANAITYEGAKEERTLAERQGDALFDIAAFFNKNHEGVGTPRHLPNVTLSADVSTLTSSRSEGVNDDTQRPMSPACTNAYLCDCKVHVILRSADGAPVSFGRAQYVVSRLLFRQVAARDGGCRFPGCNRPVRFTDAHHIQSWLDLGETEYENLVLLCSRHHHYVHQQRLHLKLLPNGDLHVTWTDGRHRVSQPRGAPPTRAPV